MHPDPGSDTAASDMIISPREISDLVYRCCRVAGCTAGAAGRLSHSVLHAEIHRSDAVATFVDAAHAGSADVERLAGAADHIERAEVRARSTGRATATFDQPVPLAALSSALWEAAERGVVASEIEPTANAAIVIESVILTRVATTPEIRSAALARNASAQRNGLIVRRERFEQLNALAREFLVAEATLDAIAP